MIQWNNVASDIEFRDLSEMTSLLSPMDVIRLTSKLTNQPLIIIESVCKLKIYQHLASSYHELGGLLLGKVHVNPINGSPNIILIKESIASTVFQSTSVSLRMASDIWSSARARIDDGLIVTGWYHSHPNLGVFFSETDRHNQKNNFCHSYSVGYVTDPYRNEEKWFIGQSAEEIPHDRTIVVRRKN